ncbi:MAG: response regulator [Xanthobacteraceae bacterium]|nr:response regulator [Xanthobacteraceae bacterium]
MIESPSDNHSEQKAGPTKSTIVIVDDDFDVLKSLRFLLETEGFQVQTFSSAGALLGFEPVINPDCFVIDYKMTKMDGLELVRKLQQLEIAAPVVLITGYPDADISAKAAAVGVQHVLLKPHLEESLIAQVRAAMRENRRH